MSGIDKNLPRFSQVYEDFKPTGSRDGSQPLRGTTNGQIFLKRKDGDNGPSEREQGFKNVYDSIARDYGKDIADTLFPGGGTIDLKRSELPVLKESIEILLQKRFDERGGQGTILGSGTDLSKLVKDDYLPKDEQYRRDQQQFKEDLEDLKELRGGLPQDVISRMMKHAGESSENRAWGSLKLGLGKGQDQHWAQVMPDEVRLNITQRMGPQREERDRLKEVLIAIDGAKRSVGTDKELGDTLSKFVQWVGDNEDHGLPKELVDAIVEFRETWIHAGRGPREQMDRLGLPEEVKEPLKKALDLRSEWSRSHPGERPSHPGDERPSYPSRPELPDYDPGWEQYYQELGDYNSYPGLLESYPQRLKEWEDQQKRHVEIGRVFTDHLQNIPTDGVPEWLLDQLR